MSGGTEVYLRPIQGEGAERPTVADTAPDRITGRAARRTSLLLCCTRNTVAMLGTEVRIATDLEVGGFGGSSGLTFICLARPLNPD